jgi:carbonic anhydrase/acetyltransferase-like protein (isoleucine patch superfamily)
VFLPNSLNFYHNKGLQTAIKATKVSALPWFIEVTMTTKLRRYKDLFPKTGQHVMIDASSVVIGDVRIADDVSIWPLVAIRGDVNHVEIGARTNVQDGSVLHVTHKSPSNPQGNPLIIGDDVTIGHKVMLHGCTIGNRVLVGMGSILLDGVIVEEDVMIGAGSLVPQNKRLESGHLYFGNPVKQIRPLTEAEIAGLKYSANNYVRWKNDYLTQDNQTHP